MVIKKSKTKKKRKTTKLKIIKIPPIPIKPRPNQHGGQNRVELPEKAAERVQAYAGYGMRLEQIAALLGMNKSTFGIKCKEYPELVQSLIEGRAIAARQVTKTAYEMAKSGKDAVMTKYWLNCQQGWREGFNIDATLRRGASAEDVLEKYKDDPKLLEALLLLADKTSEENSEENEV
jgi:hypothetical protein